MTLGSGFMNKMLKRTSSINSAGSGSGDHTATTSKLGSSRPFAIEYNVENLEIKGWLGKQNRNNLNLSGKKNYTRRYFALSGLHLAYYDTEDILVSNPRQVYEIADILPYASEQNGLLISLTNGKELKLLADTRVSYKSWLTSVQNMLSKKKIASRENRVNQDTTALNRLESSNSSVEEDTKSGWMHYYQSQEPEKPEKWIRYYVVVQKDTMNCYESDQKEAELEISGIIRSVSNWQGKELGIIVRLNKNRKLCFCFDSQEEKTSWQLTLQFSLNQVKKEARAMLAKQKTRKIMLERAAKEKKNSEEADDSGAAESSGTKDAGSEDDGVWI